MSTPAQDRWKRVRPYLDEALALSEQEQSVWLASLRQHDADLAREIEQLLNKQNRLIESNFLEDQAVSICDHSGRTGLMVGAYTLISPIGQGGMSTVWLAERNDGRFQRKVAVKFLSIALYGRGEERFRREGSILGRLAHPHVAQLLDAGVSSSGEPYLVLEHVDGEHIDKYCDERRLSIEERCRLFLDVIGAVSHAHANLIVHRDIKPSNVLVTKDGHVKLLDFGIAKLLEDQSADANLTREGGSALTPQYAAPEQLTNGPITTATDVYALGVLLYKLLSGQHPAGSRTHSHSDLVKAIVEEEPAPMSKLVATVLAEDAGTAAVERSTAPDKLKRSLRGDLETIVGKALKKDPHDRYASVISLGDDVRRYLAHEPVLARRDTIPYRAAKFLRRNRMTTALATLAAVALVTGLATILVQARSVRRQRDFAYRELARAEQVNNLNYFLLTDAIPSDQPVSINELVSDEQQFVQREDYKDNAANHVKLLITVGNHYLGRDQDDKAVDLLQQAYVLSRSLQDHSARAQASCGLAMAVDRTGQHARAESLISEGLNELNSSPEFALDRVLCLVNGSDISQADGAAQQGILRAQEAEAVLRDAPYQPDTLKLSVLLSLAGAYSLAGQPREAIPAYEAASAELSKLGLDATRTAVTLYNDWGLSLMLANRSSEAGSIYSRGIALSRGNRRVEEATASLLINYADSLVQVGHLKEAITYAEQASVKAKATNDVVTFGFSLMERAKIYRAQQDFGQATSMLDELEPLLRRSLPPDHYAFASIASERSLIAEGRGDLQTALKLATVAISLDEAAVKHGGQGAFKLWSLYLERAGIEMSTGLSERAVSDATIALEMAKNMANPGTFSVSVGQCSLMLGRALEAEGKHDQARASAVTAAEHFRQTLGFDHPQTIAARQLAGLGK